jgi:hypothetical protein
MGSVTSLRNLNIEDQELRFIWPLPFTCQTFTALPVPYAPASLALKVIWALSPPLHDKAVVLKECMDCYHNESLRTDASLNKQRILVKLFLD